MSVYFACDHLKVCWSETTVRKVLELISKPEATVLAVFTGFFPRSGAAFPRYKVKRENVIA